MIASFFNSIFNTLVRYVDWSTRITISFVFIILAVFTLMLSIRKKNDAHPLSIGWFLLSLIAMGLSVMYVTI